METVELVQVIWDDACHARAVKDTKPLRMMSFGLLLKDEKDGIVIAQSQSEVGEFLDCLFIPRGVVVEIAKIPVPVGKGTISAVIGWPMEAGKGRA